MLAIGSKTYEEQSDVDGKRTFCCAINAAFCAGSGCPGWRCLRGRCRLSSCWTGWSRCWGCSWWCRRRGSGCVRSQSLLLSLSFLFLSQKTLLPSQKVFTPLGERIGLVKATSGIRRDSIPRQNCVTVPVVTGRHELLLDLPKFGSHALGHRLPSEHEAAAVPPGRAIMLEP